MKFSRLLIVFVSATLLASCTSDEKFKQQMSKVLKEDPKILTEAIEKHPAEFITALQNAAKIAQEAMGNLGEVEEK